MWLSILYHDRVSLKSPFCVCVNRSPIRYDFGAGVKAIKYSVNIAIIFFYGDNVTRLALCEEGMIHPSCRNCTGFFDELQEVII